MIREQKRKKSNVARNEKMGNNENSGVSLIALVITIIVVIILAAIMFGGSTRTITNANYSDYVNNVSEVYNAFHRRAITIKGQEAAKGNNVTDAQVYNYLAKNGKSSSDFLVRADLPNYTVIKDENQIGMKLPKMRIENALGKMVNMQYAVTSEGDIFTWPPFEYEENLRISSKDTATEKGSGETSTVTVGDKTFVVSLDEDKLLTEDGGSELASQGSISLAYNLSYYSNGEFEVEVIPSLSSSAGSMSYEDYAREILKGKNTESELITLILDAESYLAIQNGFLQEGQRFNTWADLVGEENKDKTPQEVLGCNSIEELKERLIEMHDVDPQGYDEQYNSTITISCNGDTQVYNPSSNMSSVYFYFTEAGEYPVEATASNGRTGESIINIKKIVPESAFVNIGDTITLTAEGKNETLKWTSSNPAVATVSSSGVVTAISQGEAVITVTNEDETAVSNECFINVIPPYITISPTTATVTVGKTVNLSATGVPGTLKWKSSNPAVATVSSSGVVTGVSVGTAYITATNENETAISNQCEVVSIMGPRSIADLVGSGEIKIGDYINYNTFLISKTYKSPSGETGYTSDQTLTTDTSVGWRVIYMDNSKIWIVPEKPVSKVNLLLTRAYINGPAELHKICRELYSSTTLGTTANSMTIENLETALSVSGDVAAAKASYVNNYSSNSGEGGTREYTRDNYWIENNNGVTGGTEGDSISGTSLKYFKGSVESPVTATQTYYTYNNSNVSSPVWNCLGRTDLRGTGWLASTCVSLNAYYADFNVYCVSGSSLGSHGVGSSNGNGGYARDFGVRPLVSLPSSLQLNAGGKSSHTSQATAWQIDN